MIFNTKHTDRNYWGTRVKVMVDGEIRSFERINDIYMLTVNESDASGK
jgi:hypothetical protein